MNWRLLVLVIVVCIAVIGTFFLGSRPIEQSGDKLRVVTSFYPLYFFASEIGGERAEVHNIVPAGAEAHDYEPTAQDLVALETSDVLILNGAGFEAWGSRVQQNIGTSTLLVAAGEGLATLMGEAHEEHGEAHEEEEHEAEAHGEEHEEHELVVDPHVWLSPILAQTIVNRIAGGYMNADPENAGYYQANADALKAELAALDGEYRAGLASCARRDIITSHAAFGYVANAYGLRQVAISGLSTEEEPSAQELAEVAEFARANNVQFIFFETLVPSDLSETIANEVGAQTLVLNPIEGLTDAEIASGKDYLSEMRGNLANLKIALECR